MLNWNKHNHANFLTSLTPQINNAGLSLIRTSAPNELASQLTLGIEATRSTKLGAIECIIKFMQERHKAQVEKNYPWRVTLLIGSVRVLINLSVPSLVDRNGAVAKA